MDYADGDAVGEVAARMPGGHFGQEADGFVVERFVAAFDHPDVGDAAVGVNYETASDAPFNALAVGVCWILAIFVDVVE